MRTVAPDAPASQPCRPGRDVLRETGLIYVAPAARQCGVGDYATDFAAHIKSRFKTFVEVRTESNPTATARTVVGDIRRIRALAETLLDDGPTIAHFEQSGGSLAPFWGALLSRGIPVTATIHDPPQPVWWPFATRSIARSKVLHHGLHYPLRFATNALQRRMGDGRVLVALTSVGARQARVELPGAQVRASRHYIPTRPPLTPLTDRPLAVGLFGHLYQAKGFHKVGHLRACLDDDIEILVAGRGTEAIAPQPGVTVLGEVNGTEEDAFFDRIRFLVVPYAKVSRYGRAYAASGAVARAFAYGTPVICSRDGALAEVVSEGGALGADGGIAALAARINVASRDGKLLQQLAREVDALRSDRTVANCAVPFLQAWTEIAAGIRG